MQYSIVYSAIMNGTLIVIIMLVILSNELCCLVLSKLLLESYVHYIVPHLIVNVSISGKLINYENQQDKC